MTFPLEVRISNCSREGVRILSDISFDLEAREVLAITGKSGVGKTTLLNAIAGLVNYQGRIAVPKRIGFVFQNPSLFPWMTAGENIAFALNKDNGNPLAHFLKMADIEDKLHTYPHKLSGGQKQRVAFARALGSGPELLLLDEPFANLDYLSRLEMHTWLSQVLAEEKIPAIIVTHDLEEAIYLSDRVLVLKKDKKQHEVDVPFKKPRTNDIRYSRKFQEIKRELMEVIS